MDDKKIIKALIKKERKRFKIPFFTKILYFFEDIFLFLILCVYIMFRPANVSFNIVMILIIILTIYYFKDFSLFLIIGYLIANLIFIIVHLSSENKNKLTKKD